MLSFNSYSFCLIYKIKSSVFSSRQRGHLTIPLFFNSCFIHWEKQSKWNVFLQTVAHVVVASHFTICMWQIAHKFYMSSSSSSSKIIFYFGTLFLTYLRKSRILLECILLLAIIYLNCTSVYLDWINEGWSEGMWKI